MDATAFCSNHVWKRWFWPQKLSMNAPRFESSFWNAVYSKSAFWNAVYSKISMDVTAFCSNHVWKRWFWPQKLSINAPYFYKMSRRIKSHAVLLNTLAHCSPHQRKLLIKTADKGLIDAICECVVNEIRGNVKLSSAQKRELAKQKHNLRKLADRKTANPFTFLCLYYPKLSQHSTATKGPISPAWRLAGD